MSLRMIPDVILEKKTLRYPKLTKKGQFGKKIWKKIF